MPQISAANTSMTRVSPFENGRNEKIMSSWQHLSRDTDFMAITVSNDLALLL